MKSHSFTQFTLVVSLLTFSISSYAEQWYHVELIVFEQLDTITDEQWPEMAETAPLELTPQTVSQSMQPAEVETLIKAAARLERSSSYQVQYHQAWQQPIMKIRHAEAVEISSEEGKVSGSIRLYKSTYLHAALDLWLVENLPPVTALSGDSIEEDIVVLSPSAQLDEDIIELSPILYLDSDIVDLSRNPNLKESRRIRSKKLHFFDHPKLGALLQLTPIDTPEIIQLEESLESFSLPTEAAPTASE